MKVRNVTVRIARHAGVEIEKVVPAWEVRVLNKIFDEPNVQQIGSEDVDWLDENGQPVRSLNSREVYEGLLRKYGQATDSEGNKIIHEAYRDAGDFGDAVRRMQQSWAEEAAVAAPRRGRQPAADADAIVIP